MIDWYDVVSRDFDHPSIVLWRAEELRHLQRYAGRLQGRVLDLGCAEGHIGAALFAGRRLCGLDTDAALIGRNAHETVYTALTLGDGCRMPYKDGAFGGVFSNCVIEHIRALDDLLEEVRRVLEPGGRFLFSVPSGYFSDNLFFSRLFDNAGLSVLKRAYAGHRNKMLRHYHCYGHDAWRLLLDRNGFELEAYEYYLGPEATAAWDWAAAVNAALRYSGPLLKKINKSLTKDYKKYYNIGSEKGSGLILLARVH